MSDFAAPAADSRADHQLPLKLLMAIGLAALADALFYDQRLGLSVAIFAAAVVMVSLAANHALIARHRMMTASAIFIAGLLPSVEDLNLLSFLFLMLGSTTTIAVLTDPQLKGLRAWLSDLRQLLVTGPLRLLPDAARTLSGPGLTRGLVVWFVPLVFGAAFVLLFARANPVIEQWLTAVRPDEIGRASCRERV